jgi:RNA polymerase sigma-70 factor (ECF subfamily)
VGDEPQQLAALLEHLEPDARRVLEGEAGQQLAERIAAAPAAWPGVRVPPGAFGVYLGRHLPRDTTERNAWNSWAVDELYLCCGCVQGDPEALRAFEDRFVPVIHGALRRDRLPAALREELAQDLRERLFVGRDGGAPLLERYGGLGTLAGWLRVVTARVARQTLQQEKRYVLGGDDRIISSLMQEGDPLEATYREPFRRAVRTALAELGARDLTLIRMRYVDGLTLEQIGSTYRVHLSTVHRWIGAIQERLLEQTRELMMQELGIDAAECNSLFRMLQSQLDLTITTLLRGRAPEDGP